MLSDDINRKLIDWWLLKNEFKIRLFEISEVDLIEALKLSYSAAAVDSAHQYSSARHQREELFEHHKLHLTKAEISYIEKLSTQEESIKIKYETMRDRLQNKIVKIFKKSKWK